MTISVTAKHPYPVYYWEGKKTLSDEWADIDLEYEGKFTGQGTDTITPQNFTTADEGQVRCTVFAEYMDSPWFEISNAASITVGALNITEQPVSLDVSVTPATPTEYLHDFTAKDIGAWTHARTSLATAPNESGTIITYASDDPAWYADQGLQLEDTRTNELWLTENFGHTYWRIAGTISTRETHATIPAPDGTLNAWHIASSNKTGFLYRDNVSQVTPYRSIWARTISGTGTIHVLAHNSEAAFSITESWQRLDTPQVGIGPENFYVVDFRGAGTLSEVLLWGAQQEVGAFLTSYVKGGAGAAYTRSATSCSATFAELGDPLPAGGVTNDFCFQIVIRLVVDQTDQPSSAPIMSLVTETGGDNRVTINQGYGHGVRIAVRQGGVQLTDTGVNQPFVAGDLLDIRAVIRSSGAMTIWTNGTKTVSTITDFTGFTAPIDQWRIGYNTKETNFRHHQVTQRVRLVPEALTDEQIEAWE